MPGENTEKIITTTTTEEIINQKQPQQQGFVVTTNIQPVQQKLPSQENIFLSDHQDQVLPVTHVNVLDQKVIKGQEIIHEQILIDLEKLKQKELDFKAQQIIKEEKLYEKDIIIQQKEIQREEKQKLKLDQKLMKEQQRYLREVEKTQLKEIQTQEALERKDQSQKTDIEPLIQQQVITQGPNIVSQQLFVVDPQQQTHGLDENGCLLSVDAQTTQVINDPKILAHEKDFCTEQQTTYIETMNQPFLINQQKLTDLKGGQQENQQFYQSSQQQPIALTTQTNETIKSQKPSVWNRIKQKITGSHKQKNEDQYFDKALVYETKTQQATIMNKKY